MQGTNGGLGVLGSNATQPTSPPTAAPALSSLHHQRIHALVRDNPGICLQEIADRMGLSRSATVHHMRRLARRGAIIIVRQGRRASHFIADQAFKPVEKTFLSLLRLTTTRAIIDALTKEPTLAWNELARRLNMGSHSVRWHIARLKREGLVDVGQEPFSRHHRVEVSPELRAYLAPSRVDPSPAALPSSPFQFPRLPNEPPVKP